MASTAGENQRTPCVFISYSHDNDAHCDRVRRLVEKLRRDGIDARLDQFEVSPPQGWPLWCAQGILNANYVLLICTRIYHERFLGLEAFGKGRGVKWEGKLLQNILYYSEVNAGFIPILLDDADEAHIPETVREASWYRINPDATQDGGYAQLCGRLSGGVSLPPLEIPKPSGSFRQRGDASVPTEEVWSSSAEISTKIEQIHAKVVHIEQVSVESLDILRKYVPPPSTVARPHNLPPWMPPEIFTGRVTELRELCDSLSGGDDQAPAIVQPQVIIGGGGFGKSRLAIQAAWILYMQHQCDMAFLISASSPAELDTQLAALDARSLLNLYNGEQPPPELDIRKQNVIAALREMAGRWILVLDAADSDKARDAVNELLSQLAGGRFLVTSRREDWPRSTVRKLPLDLFTIEEARACLLSRYWKSEPPVEEIADFDRVATELGFLPLALVLAASYMNSRRIPPARYMGEWKQKHDTLLGFTAVDVEQGRSLLAAFKLSHDLLSPQTARLLRVLAWLAPEPFPRRLIEDSEKMREMLSAGIEGSADPTNALAELRTLSLLQLDDESLRLHRLVLKCARATLPEDARADACAIALEWINSILPDPEYDETNWKNWNHLSPHLDEVIAAGNALKIESEALGAICGKLGLWLLHQARYNQAEPLMRRVVEIFEKSLGKEHPDVTTALSYLAQLLQATNRLEEAEPLLRRALAIDEKSYGPEDPNVAVHLNNLAQLLKATNRLEEAEPLLRRALAIDEKSCGPEHPNVATALNNLAQLLQATNRLEEAEPLMRRTVVIFVKFTRSTGHLHPNLKPAFGNYWGILAAMSLSEKEIARRIVEVGKEAGLDEQSYHALLAELSK